MDSHRLIMRDYRCKASRVWSFVMLFLTLADGSCCVSFIYPVLFRLWCPETNPVDWAQPSTLLSVHGDRVKSPKIVLNKKMMAKVQKSQLLNVYVIRNIVYSPIFWWTDRMFKGIGV